MSGQTNVMKEEGQAKKKLKLPVKAIAASAAVLFLLVVALLVEAANTRRVVIKNGTERQIESIRLYFENTEEDFYFVSEDLVNTQIAAGEKYKGNFETQKYTQAPGYFLMIRVKFADKEEAETYAGYFTRTFTGKISLNFTEEDGHILMSVKAGDGLFQSTKYTDCDEVQELFE